MHKTLPMLMLAGALAAPFTAGAQGTDAERPFAHWRADGDRAVSFHARSERLGMEQWSFAAPDRKRDNHFGWQTAATQPSAAPVGYLDVNQVSPVPEPTTTALLLAGLGVVGLLVRRRRRNDD